MPAGFIIDVPVTLTVAVRGRRMSKRKAMKIAREFAEACDLSFDFTYGYTQGMRDKGEFPKGTSVTEASLEPVDGSDPKVIGDLEDDGDDD